VDVSTDIASPVPGYGAGDRHGWLHSMCTLLEKIIVGRHAGVFLEDPEGLPETAALAQLPIWWWTRPSAPLGRKDRSADGGHLLLPVRINWVPAPVVVLPAGTELRARWSAVGLGRSGTGETVLSIDPAHTGEPGYPLGTQMIGARAQFPQMTRRQLVVGLRRLVTDGRQARWEALMALQPWVDRAVRNAHTAVAWEIGGREQPDRAAPAVLDPVGLDAVATRLMLGEDGHAGEGLVGNLLDRCLLPATFSKVEPSRYIFTTLKRDAEQEIRREIGDPPHRPQGARHDAHHPQRGRKHRRNGRVAGEQVQHPLPLRHVVPPSRLESAQRRRRPDGLDPAVERTPPRGCCPQPRRRRHLPHRRPTPGPWRPTPESAVIDVPTPPPPQVPLSRANAALTTARRQRAEWLIGLDSGLVNPMELIAHSALEGGRALRRLTLRQVLTAQPRWGDARAGEVLTRLHAFTHAQGELSALTVGWLVDNRATGARFVAWFDVTAINREDPPWPGYPVYDRPAPPESSGGTSW